MMNEDWHALFGEPGLAGVLDAFQGGEPFVVHGEPARLPLWMNHECLRSAEALCARYTGRILYGRLEGGPRLGMLERGSALELLAAGEALYLPDISEIIEESNNWIRNLESFLGIPSGSARVTGWVAPAGEGTALHLDSEDVISIQLVGTKTFEVAEAVALPYATGFQFGPGIPAAGDLYPQAAAGFPDPDSATFTAVDLQPGSLLVLPRGHWHRTRCREPSVSLSIVMSPPILADWALGVLRHRALQDPRWRRPLYGAPEATDRAQLAAGWQTLMAGLADAPGNDEWTAQTTLQRAPSKQVVEDDPPYLLDLYDGRRDSLHNLLSNGELLAQLADWPAAFTVAEARQRWGADVDNDLQALVRVGLLYRWPVPIQRD